jgi:hypothetical protein
MEEFCTAQPVICDGEIGYCLLVEGSSEGEFPQHNLKLSEYYKLENKRGELD